MVGSGAAGGSSAGRAALVLVSAGVLVGTSMAAAAAAAAAAAPAAPAAPAAAAAPAAPAAPAAAAQALEPTAAAGAAALAPARAFDFNGDGYADLAVGVPGEDIGAAGDTGGVNVIYGSASGLRAAGSQLWTQAAGGVAGAAEAGDLLGSALASADFDADGYADLAVGAPGERVGAQVAAGAVIVLRGSSRGLTATGSRFWSQRGALPGSAEAFDEFGAALTAGDFDGDGRADLAVGAPGEDGAGRVTVIYGSASGLSAARSTAWGQGARGLAGRAERGDRFGAALSAGDFDGDRRDDLAVGVPGQDLNGVEGGNGEVQVLYGGPAGLGAVRSSLWNQDTPGIEDAVTTRGQDITESFGAALAAGDTNGDGRAELAIGVPGEDIGATAAGAVHVLRGGPAGLTAQGDQFWHQDTAGIKGRAEEQLGVDGDVVGEGFGRALAMGDVTGDGRAELAIGIPTEGVVEACSPPSEEDRACRNGAVTVLRGSAAGLTATGDQLWHQEVPGVEGVARRFDRFGAALTIGRFDTGAAADLAVGVPVDDVGPAARVGAVNVLYGAAGGLRSTGGQRWSQLSPGVPGGGEPDDRFGAALPSGRR